MSNTTTQGFGVREATVSVRIQADRARVWQAITEETGSWWQPDFCVGGPDAEFRIEGHLGGRMFESWGEGEGLIWAQVTGCRKHEYLLLNGALTSEFGGPARTHITFRLEESDGATLVTLTECAFGRVDTQDRSTTDGWEMLLSDGLKAFVEGAG